MDYRVRGLRGKALQKIAALSAASTTKPEEDDDLERLYQLSPHSTSSVPNGIANGYGEEQQRSLSGVAMNVREFEVLIALCKAAPLITDCDKAKSLAAQLAPYTREAHTQVFVPSPFFRGVEPSPIESLSYNLTSALLTLGINYDGLQQSISADLLNYLDRCESTTSILIARNAAAMENEGLDSVEDAIEVARVAMSLLGFLDAAATYAYFWSADERLAVISTVKKILSDEFLVAAETSFSRIRNHRVASATSKEWKIYLRHYAATGRPLGGMLLRRSLMWLLVATSSLMIADAKTLRRRGILELLMGDTASQSIASHGATEKFAGVQVMAGIAADEMSMLDDGADYLRIGSAWQQQLASAVKAGALTSYLNCAIVNGEAADADTLIDWLEEAVTDPDQMADGPLANAVLRCVALAARLSPGLAPDMTKLLPRFIKDARGETVAVASTCLAFILRQLSHDTMIATLYSLGNILTPTSNPDRIQGGQAASDSVNGFGKYGLYRKQDDSGSSVAINGERETVAYGNIIQAIRIIAESCADDKITALAHNIIVQKLHKIDKSVDATIIYEAAGLAIKGTPADLKTLFKNYGKLTEAAVANDDQTSLAALLKTRNHLSATLAKGTAAYDIYVENLLETIISKGDVHQAHRTRESDVELAAKEIETLIQPLARLMSGRNMAEESENDHISSLVRDAWFNMVVHGFTTCTERGKKYIDELRIIAAHSTPLVTEKRGEQLESDIELNAVLLRGMNSDHEAMQKKRLSSLIPSKASEIRSLSYRKIIFLHTAYLVETLRAESADCSKALVYFLEPGMRTGDMSNVMEAITTAVMDTYLRKAMSGIHPDFSAPRVADQLVSIFSGCCHRIEKVQQAAIMCADKILANVTSALCQRSSLFALLELVTLMWTSCIEAEVDEYEWKSSLTSACAGVTIQLGDNFEFRKKTLNILSKKAKSWLMDVINIAPLDVKGLLQTYLSEYEDDGAYGHVSLGRSLAAEMGGMIPDTDQKLGAISRHAAIDINSISDFIAQYTTRQEYRFAEALPDYDANYLNLMRIAKSHESIAAPSGKGADYADALTVLAKLDAQMQKGHLIPIADLRDILRRVAALLCRTKEDDGLLVKYFVGIPFAHFSKETMKLGISLWLGVINENPRMESKILVEVANQWENTIHKKQGIFHDQFKHHDPFFVKEEYAPSDRESLHKKQHVAQNLLAPHLRLLQFLSSHFNATRLCSPHIQKIFVRLLRATLAGLMHSTGHPLARELRLQIIMFGLRVLKYSTVISTVGQCRLKDQILSAALSWFAFPPRFSFGGNRLQVKAESRLLSDVAMTLKSVNFIGPQIPASLRNLQDKEELLLALLDNEQFRLRVWLSPLHDAKDPYIYNGSGVEPSEVVGARMVRTAWSFNPSLAVSLVSRFRSPRFYREIRELLLAAPWKAIEDPEALSILLGGVLPSDVSWQLKYLLYWAPVNPITAVTYFLPSHGNHPFAIQYAMRALESHNIDVTFFYVPQIVQSLRFDALGYIERYILETAKFSQLFAHQIIWNMKANMYKDDDSLIPDPLKPTLDHIIERMVSSFTGADRDFYEREFAFFTEVTNVSGKLKPFIKRPKPEKKEKIEEELRKIKVDVGVYLPTNPDGVVIGIDRKSGKPLQSHAKAPYMATFRVKKQVGADVSSVEAMMESGAPEEETATTNSVEVWQSSIFKVGDDCRQDVLALQMIAAFRGIFNTVGLDVFVFPYHVVSTAPGCGVIEVLPNSVSRDMLGREAVNGLYDYFVTKYGNEDSVRFQEARANFVKSMAAYSIISFLLQFKDRHNGNIMIDDAGHIIHIDFGFCFDIAPGGVKFERAPFKLTSEMVAVMGGRAEHQSYKWFEELCVKAFLASRLYVDKLSQLVLLMMESGLPCFKPESVQHFRERFVLEKSDREAAAFVRGLVKSSHGSHSTGVYDQFQLLTNGIPC